MSNIVKLLADELISATKEMAAEGLFVSKTEAWGNALEYDQGSRGKLIATLTPKNVRVFNVKKGWVYSAPHGITEAQLGIVTERQLELATMRALLTRRYQETGKMWSLK